MGGSAQNDFESHDESDSVTLLDQRLAVPNMRRGSLYVVTTLLLLGAAAMYARGVWHAESRNTEEAIIQKYEEAVVVPPYEQCSKISEDCSSTKCCKTAGYKCFKLRDNKASCKANCTPSKDGMCTELVNLKSTHTTGTQLFCFSFYTENTGSTKKSYELDLFKKQLAAGISLFGCPKYAVYSDVEASLSSSVKTIKVNDVDGNFHLFKRKKSGTWVNAMMFYQAWLDIRSNKLAASSDWVVKVDADAVFLPVRLLHTLQGFKVPDGGVYVENCPKVMFGFFGNLEVVSQDGFASFLANLETCKSTLDWKGEDPDWKFGPYGEDLFMQKCLDKIGVSKVSNFTMTTDGACKAAMPRMEGVKAGVGLPNCLDTNAVSYHPLKKPADYLKCYAQTTQTSWDFVA